MLPSRLPTARKSNHDVPLKFSSEYAAAVATEAAENPYLEETDWFPEASSAAGPSASDFADYEEATGPSEDEIYEMEEGEEAVAFESYDNTLFEKVAAAESVGTMPEVGEQTYRLCSAYLRCVPVGDRGGKEWRRW